MNGQSMQNLKETNKPETSVNLVQRVLDEAQKHGATAAEAEIGTGTGFAA